MVAGKQTLRFSILGAICLHMTPAMAQERGGIQTVFGVQQGLEFGRNTELSTVTEDTQTTAATRLSYGISSETRTQRISLDAASTFRFENADGETSSDFEAPTVTLAYTLDGATSALGLSGTFSRQEIDTLPLISDFLGPDGVLDLPEDFTDLSGTGERTSYDVAGQLILGRDGPLEFQFDLGASGTTYRDTVDPDLTDTTSTSVEAITRLQISEVLEANVGLRYAVTEEDDATDTRRIGRDIDLGLVYAISPGLTFDAAIGSSRTDTERTTGDSETTGLTGRLGLGYDLANGDIRADFDAGRDVAGDRVLNLRLSRNLALPTGSLSASIGATQPGTDEPSLVGALDWLHEGPTSQVALRLSRSVSVDSDADIRDRTIAGVFYGYTVNPISSLSLGFNYIVDEESSATTRVERTDLTGTYNYALTQDWDLSAGLGYSIRDEETVGRADSSVITLSIGREFASRR